MRFVVLGFDGTDSEAPARRAAARPAHLEGIPALLEAGTLKYGGPLFDAEGNMNGSIMILEYPSEEALCAEFLSKEAYAVGNVWQKIEIHPHKAAPFCE